MCKFEPHYLSVLSRSQCFSDDKEMIIYLNKARLAIDRDKPVNSAFGISNFFYRLGITQGYQL